MFTSAFASAFASMSTFASTVPRSSALSTSSITRLLSMPHLRLLWLVYYLGLVRFVDVYCARVRLSAISFVSAVLLPALSALSAFTSVLALFAPTTSSIACLLYLSFVRIFYDLSAVCALFALDASAMLMLGHPQYCLRLLGLYLHCLLYLRLCLRLRLDLRLNLRLLFIVSFNQVYLHEVKS